MRSGQGIGLITAGIALATIAACQQNSDASTTALPVGGNGSAVGTAGMKRVEVYDPMFQQLAYTVMIPNDWVLDGTVIRTQFAPSQVFRASTPDGLTGVQVLPAYNWISTNNRGMLQFYQNQRTVIAPPMAASEVMTKFVLPETRPGVQVVGTEPAALAVAGGVEFARKANAQFEAEAARSGQKPRHMTTDAARTRIRYELHGRPVEEALLVTTMLTDMPLQQGGEVHYSFALVTAARAPAGRFEATEKLLTSIIASVTVDQAWQAKQDAFQLRSAQEKQQAILANAERYRRMNKAIFDASMRSAKALSDAGHTAAMATAEHMGDVQSMINPSTGKAMKVSNQFNYSYADENGNVVHTNSATYNPNGQMRGNWTQLQPMKPQ